MIRICALARARIQQSFRRDPRTTLALQGKNKTLDNQGFYEVLDQVNVEEREQGALLPTLDPVKLHKLEDDLLNGIHVTYHHKGEVGTGLDACRNFSSGCSLEFARVFC